MARQCPPNTFLYTIQQNDSLIRISNRFNVPIPAILSANPQINYYSTLYIGNTLCIPKQPVYPPCPEGNYYRIQPGDMFYKIAAYYNVSVDDLLEANPGVDPNRLYIGQVICIPLATPPGTCPENSEAYIIQAGDTFYKLAQQFNTTIDEIVRLNPGLNPYALLIGQKMCIPKDD